MTLRLEMAAVNGTWMPRRSKLMPAFNPQVNGACRRGASAELMKAFMPAVAPSLPETLRYSLSAIRWEMPEKNPSTS